VIFIIILWSTGLFIDLPQYLTVKTLVPGWTGIVLGITCLIQFGLSMMIDSRYDRNITKNYFWIIWYPVVFWLINVFTVAVGVPKALMKPKGQPAVWVSPDRGLQN
jgi:biofilm PGA synthesis N-glycosyltransferase PgaC